ncbi:MAG: diguanylate cyclase, partial [Gammaproteobacteria bacterium]
MRNCKVLLVGGTESEAKLVMKHLKRVNGLRFSVDHCARLDAGVQRATEQYYDVILLDLNLPDCAGIEVCQRMHKAAPHIPVVVLIDKNNEELDTKAMCENARDYLIKREVDGPMLGRAIRDAIEHERTEQALRQSEQRYSLAVSGANDGIWDWSLTDNQVHFSPRWKAILGYSEQDITDRIEEWFDRIDPRDKELFDEALNLHLEGNSSHFECEYRLVARGDEIRWVLSRGSAVRDEAGQPLRISGLMTDITRRKKTETRLLHEAMHDALTGLPNRNLFIDRLDLALRRFRRDHRRLFAVLFFDLDRFKHINDSLGHAVGDELLVQIAGRLDDCLRPGDTLARLGG